MIKNEAAALTVRCSAYGVGTPDVNMRLSGPVTATGERAKPRNLTVVQAAADGSHREMLVAIRARIAQTVEATDCPPVALAALVKTLQSISKDLRVLMQHLTMILLGRLPGFLMSRWTVLSDDEAGFLCAGCVARSFRRFIRLAGGVGRAGRVNRQEPKSFVFGLVM